jgi:hypothetical protein
VGQAANERETMNFLDMDRVEDLVRPYSQGGLGHMTEREISHHLQWRSERTTATIDALVAQKRVQRVNAFGRSEVMRFADAKSWGWS